MAEREECSRGGETEGGIETRSERGRGPPGSCFSEVSTPDKVFMTLGQFSADIQELHATRPLMKVSWLRSSEPQRLSWSKPTFSTSCCYCTSDWEPQHQPGRLISHNVQPLLAGILPALMERNYCRKPLIYNTEDIYGGMECWPVRFWIHLKRKLMCGKLHKTYQ